MSSAETESDAEPEAPHPPRVGPDNLDLDAVGRVAARIQLRDVRLYWGHMQLNCEPSDLALDWGDHAQIGYDVHVRGRTGAQTVRIQVVFFAHYNADWDPDEETPELSSDPENPDDVEVACSFIVDYDLLDEVDEADLGHFAFYNARFNAWPYWREFAHTATTRMGIPPLIIPVLHVQKLQPSSVNRDA